MLYVFQCGNCEKPFVNRELGAVAHEWSEHLVTMHGNRDLDEWRPPLTAVLALDIADVEIVDDDRGTTFTPQTIPKEGVTLYAHNEAGDYSLRVELAEDAGRALVWLGPRPTVNPGAGWSSEDRPGSGCVQTLVPLRQLRRLAGLIESYVGIER